MPSLTSLATSPGAILGICGLVTFIHSFHFHPRATLQDLSFAIIPGIWENSRRVSWATILIITVPLGIAVMIGATVVLLTLAAFFRRRLVFWPGDYPEQGRDFLGKPLLFPARLSHARMFPEKYHYWYSYFLVGVPVGLHARVGTVLSIDINCPIQHSVLDSAGCLETNKRGKKCWFTIDPVQYLDRGNDHLGLEGKLHAFLRSQVRSHLWYATWLGVNRPRAKIQSNGLMRICLVHPNSYGGRKVPYPTGIFTHPQRS